MHIEDFNQITPRLEPGASAGGGDTEPYLVSIAISLKRIADAMEPIIVSGQDLEKWPARPR